MSKLNGMTAEEEDIMDHLIAAFNGIIKLGLKANEDQLCMHMHGMQQFVQQRVLNRMDPYWSDWYDD